MLKTFVLLNIFVETDTFLGLFWYESLKELIRNERLLVYKYIKSIYYIVLYYLQNIFFKVQH